MQSIETPLDKILIDGILKVFIPGDSHKFFGRKDWKVRYCLISETKDNGSDHSEIQNCSTVLTVYKSKKFLTTASRESAKVSFEITLDADSTVLSEDKISQFEFHLGSCGETFSFACDTKYMRDSWCSRIQSLITSKQQHRDQNFRDIDLSKDEDLESLPNDLTAPLMSSKASIGSIGGGPECIRIQLKKEHDMPEQSDLILDLASPKRFNSSMHRLNSNSDDENKAFATMRPQKRPSASLPPKPPPPVHSNDIIDSDSHNEQQNMNNPLWMKSKQDMKFEVDKSSSPHDKENSERSNEIPYSIFDIDSIQYGNITFFLWRILFLTVMVIKNLLFLVKDKIAVMLPRNHSLSPLFATTQVV